MFLETSFLLALGVTIAIETAVLLAGWRWFGGGAPLRWRRLCLAGVLPSAASMPYLWFILPRFVNGPAYLPLGESLAVLAEWPILAALLDWRPGRSLLASLSCNGASFLLGPLVLHRLSALLHLQGLDRRIRSNEANSQPRFHRVDLVVRGVSSREAGGEAPITTTACALTELPIPLLRRPASRSR